VLYLAVTLVLFFLPGGAPAKAPGSTSSVSSQ